MKIDKTCSLVIINKRDWKVIVYRGDDSPTEVKYRIQRIVVVNLDEADEQFLENVFNKGGIENTTPIEKIDELLDQGCRSARLVELGFTDLNNLSKLAGCEINIFDTHREALGIVEFRIKRDSNNIKITDY